MCLGRNSRRIKELEKDLLRQQGEIHGLRSLVYDRTRLWYGPSEPVTVGEVVFAICNHLNVRLEFVYPPKTETGRQLIVVSDDETKE